MEEDQRLFLSARVNLFRLLAPVKDTEQDHTPLAPEAYSTFKEALTSFNLGQGSHGYRIPVSAIKEADLDLEAWKKIAPPMGGATDTLHLTDNYHVCELDNVLDHLINQNHHVINTLTELSDMSYKASEMKRA